MFRPMFRAMMRGLTRKQAARWVLAGPAALLLALFVLAGMPVWMPPGPSRVDHIMVPLIVFPGIWGAAFFYAVLADRLWRVAAVFAAIVLFPGWLAHGTGGW